jgi:lipoic acid synthetase
MNPLKKKPRTKELNTIPAKPDWMKVRLPFPKEDDVVDSVRLTVSSQKLNTVCESASCPNLNHCWSRRTATFMLLGDICTRRCKYCDVAFGKPGFLDLEEPKRVAESAYSMNLNHIVLTSVNRDDLKDGGSNLFSETIQSIRKKLPHCKIEVLIPDFKNKEESLLNIANANPDIVNHNIETVKELFEEVCPQKNYETSLSVLKWFGDKGFQTKSGLILGLGETDENVESALLDLFGVGVRRLTLGQYLQPSPTHLPVNSYRSPEDFQRYKLLAKKIGFQYVMSGPLVRSSYHADEQESLN